MSGNARKNDPQRSANVHAAVVHRDGYRWCRLRAIGLLCPVILRAGQRMVFTARHCLWKSPRPCEASIRATIEHLWIPENLCISRPESLGLANPRVAHAENYRAASDLVIIDVLDTNSSAGPPFFCDLGVVPLYKPNLGDKLVVSGFPKAINRIEYPEGEVEGKLRPSRCDAGGIFVGEGTAPCCRTRLTPGSWTTTPRSGTAERPAQLRAVK